MIFLTAGMGGGTGTGAAPVIAKAAREMGILTVGVVTKPFLFESGRRMKVAEGGIVEMQKAADTLIIIPNQNLFRIANEKTTFADAFAMADQVLCSGISCITDLVVKEGLVNLDFADVCSIMSEMGSAMIGTGEGTGERRAFRAAEAAISNPLLHDTSMKTARGVLISITGGEGLTLFEVDEAANRIRQEVDADANIIVGATVEPALHDAVRVSVVATGLDHTVNSQIVSMSGWRPAEPVPHLTLAAAESPEPAPMELSSPWAHAPIPVNAVETESLSAPVIPFPAATEARYPIRRRSFLERLGVTSETRSPARASGWR
jgi:cell division protein FtsZ